MALTAALPLLIAGATQLPLKGLLKAAKPPILL